MFQSLKRLFVPPAHIQQYGTLTAASERGDVTAVSALLAHGERIDKANQEAICTAVERGHIEVVRILLRHGADPNARNGFPLYCASEKGDLEQIKLLAANGGQLTRSWYSPAAAAAARDHIPVLEFFRSQGVSFDSQVFSSALRSVSEATVKYLLDAGCDIHYDNDAALRTAVEKNRLDLCEMLISRGAYIHACDGEAVSKAAENGNLGMLKLLVSNGASIHADSDRPLRRAVYNGHLEVVKYLIDAGAFIEVNNGEPLHYARDYRHFHVLRYLVGAGARLDRRQHGENAPYIPLASEILDYGKKAQSRKDFLAAFGFDKDILQVMKGDAFKKDGPWIEHPIVQCSLDAAMVATILCPEDVKTARRIFATLFRADIERVNSTPNLSWSKYRKYLEGQLHNIVSLKDIVTEVAEVFVLPEAVGKKDKEDQIRQKMPGCIARAAELLCRGKTTLDFGPLNARWHRPSLRVPLELRPLKMVGEWHRLFEKFDAGGGFSIECLGSPAELEEEGNALSHCVGRGGYSSACQDGHTHIISVRFEGVSQATVELHEEKGKGGLFESRGGTTFKVRQFRGHKNQDPRPECYDAWNRFVKAVREETVCPGSARGTTARAKDLISRYSSALEIRTGIPEEVRADMTDRIRQHYKERIFVQRNNGQRIALLAGEK